MEAGGGQHVPGAAVIMVKEGGGGDAKYCCLGAFGSFSADGQWRGTAAVGKRPVEALLSPSAAGRATFPILLW